jgi:hypothetical protein
VWDKIRRFHGYFDVMKVRWRRCEVERESQPCCRNAHGLVAWLFSRVELLEGGWMMLPAAAMSDGKIW